MEIPQFVTTILDRLHASGYQAYLVGGCVRDMLLGRTPLDYDVTTCARPKQVKTCFSDMLTVDTGIVHGTVTVVSDGHPVEVTTFRRDGAYSDGRHPDQVVFTDSLLEDVQRRDFTVNALAYSQECGVLDYVNGRADLAARLIRCVGQPDRRFREDGLRLFRCVRFACTLQFTVEAETQKQLFAYQDDLLRIAPERIAAELKKLLVCDGIGGIDAFREVLAVVLPEIQPMFGFDQHNPYHHLDVWTHTLTAMNHVSPDLVLRLAMLFHDSGKPHCFTQSADGTGHFYGHAAISRELAEKALWRLRLERKTIQSVALLVANHDERIEETPISIKRWLNRLGEENFFRLIQLKRADNASKSPEKRQALLASMDRLESMAREMIQSNACYSLRQLAVHGDDLIGLGFRQGKEIGQWLDRLLEQVMTGELPNDRQRLLAYVEQNK